MSSAPPPLPQKRPCPIPWWMPNEPTVKRIGVFAAVCLPVVIGVAIGLCAMYRLHKWLRRRRDGGPTLGELTTAAEPKYGDKARNNNSRGSGVADFPLGSQPPSTSPAADNTTSGGFKHSIPYSVAAGAGLLPGHGSTTSSARTTYPLLPTSAQHQGADNPKQPPLINASSAPTPLALHGCPSLERQSSNSSRHDSSRSFPAGVCSSGLDSPGKGTLDLMDARVLQINDAIGLCLSKPSRSSVGGRVGGKGGGNNRRGVVRGAGAVAERVYEPEVAVPTAAEEGLGMTGKAVEMAGDVLTTAAPGTGASAARGKGIEEPLALGAPATPTPRHLRAPAAEPSASVPLLPPPSPPPPPPLAAPPSEGSGMHSTRALFETYNEREIEQRLRKVVFGSYSRQGTAASLPVRPQLSGCSSCGDSNPAARQQQQQQSGFSSVGGTLSLELTLRWSPSEAAASPPVAVLGCSVGAVPPVPSGMLAGWPPHANPADTPRSKQAASPRTLLHGGGVAALSARDLLLGHTSSGPQYCYGAYHTFLQHNSAVAAPGLTVRSSQPALPLLTTAVSVPTPQAPLLASSNLHAASTDAARVHLSPQAAPSKLSEGPALAARSTQGSLDHKQARKTITDKTDISGPGTGPEVTAPSTSLSSRLAEEAISVAPDQLMGSARSAPAAESGCGPSSICPSPSRQLAKTPTVGVGGSVEATGTVASTSAGDGTTVTTLSGRTMKAAGVASARANTVPPSSNTPSNGYAAAVAGLMGSNRGRSSGGGSQGSSPQPCTVAAVLACLAGEDLSQERPQAVLRQSGLLTQQLSVPVPYPNPQPQQHGHQVDPNGQSALAARRFPHPQPPKARPRPMAQPPRPLQLGPPCRQQGGATERHVEQSITPLDQRISESESVLGGEGSQRQEGAGAGNMMSRVPVDREQSNGTLTAAAVASASDFAEGRTERLWGLRRSNSSSNNRATSSRRIRYAGMVAAVAGVAAALAQGPSEILCMDGCEGYEAHLAPQRSAQMTSGQRAGQEQKCDGGVVVAGASPKEAQVGPRGPLQLALMVPRVWPALGAVGMEGPLAKCIAERLMTSNPLFRHTQDCFTPPGLDSGTEDE